MLPNIDVNLALQFIAILLVSIDLHELAHGWVADWLGDLTPRRNGQLSLNPFVHMDQFGILLLVVTSFLGYPFTWGRTFVQPQNLRFGPQRGGAIVAAAGPLTNLALAAVLGVIVRIILPAACQSSGCIGGLNITELDVASFLVYACYVNLILFALNLLPIPPLDGFSIVAGFLTPRQMYALAPYRQYAPLILLLIFFIPQPNILQLTVYNPADFLLHVIVPRSC
jgi:Zn-dependent protease